MDNHRCAAFEYDLMAHLQVRFAINLALNGDGMKLRVVGIVAVILGAGCASAPPVDQAQIHKTESRIRVTTDSENEHGLFSGLDKRVYITHVDDASTNTICFHFPDCYAQKVFVSPGRHYLKLKFTYLNRFARTTVWFDAEEGRSYVVRRKLSGYGVQFWVEDLATGRPVGGLPGAEEETEKKGGS
jgi:hypothetical protein